MSENHGKRKAPGRVSWLRLVICSGGTVAFIWAVARAGLVLERLLYGPDREGAYPGVMPVYAPDEFRSADGDES